MQALAVSKRPVVAGDCLTGSHSVKKRRRDDRRLL